ncbi:MAG: dihydrolipoyl dehydrogenase [Thermoplasmatota archaeon]
MKEYDVIAIGTGSVMSVVTQVLNDDPNTKIAVVEKDEAGGICLTRGCIPSKMVLYPAEITKHIKESGKFGINSTIKNIDFKSIMKRMKQHTMGESKNIEKNLKNSEHLDFYHTKGEFIDDHTLKVGKKKIKGKKILICSGSQPTVPPIKGLRDVDYITSREFLDLKSVPKSMTIIGGGYIAAEYGFFMAMMGCDVTIIGRNIQFVPGEEEEISNVLEKRLSEDMDIYTGFEVKEVKKGIRSISVIAENSEGKKIKKKSEKILVAAGRSSNAEYLKPERTGVKTDENGWIKVDEHLATTKENIWAMGDAIGGYLFKHVANYEANVVYSNAFQNKDEEVDYHAVPHAVFTYPEVASVGMKEEEARKDHDILIGYERYSNTAKGSAMKAEDFFVKVIVEKETYRILGAHIVGPQASVLIQEIINLMYTSKQNMIPIYRGMHIHPSMSEVVERAFFNLHSHEHSHEH